MKKNRMIHRFLQAGKMICLGSMTLIYVICGKCGEYEASELITPEEGLELLIGDTDLLLLDVRETDEFEEGHIPGAKCISYLELEESQSELPEDQEFPIIVYCRSGRRSAIAADTLTQMGYQNVMDMGGIIDWPYAVVIGEMTKAATEAASETEAEHEHVWEDYDCNYQICKICEKLRNYPQGGA